MKVIDHYAISSEPLISFEIIPPKRGGSIQTVFKALDQVMRFKPPFIDITSHAAEADFREYPDGTIKRQIKRKRPGTIGLAAALKHRYDVDVVPHLICKGFTMEETEDALIELNYLGIENVLAIRGDDHAFSKPHNKDRQVNDYAVDLVRQIEAMNQGQYLEELMDAHPTNFCIGVGGYPEKHKDAPNMASDIRRVKEKVDAGADYIVTQLFYDNAHYFSFVDACRASGITVPIIPGIKVLTRAEHLNTLPGIFHVDIPLELCEAVSAEPTRAVLHGIEWAKKQCMGLLDAGVQGLHFYIMADPKAAIQVIETLPIPQNASI